MPVLMPEPKNTLLGKETVYSDQYNPDLLQPIARSLGRDAIGEHQFRGVDIWRLYELSWLNQQGIPQPPNAELTVPATTPFIVESKSLKLYAGSFAMTRVENPEEVSRRITADLSDCLGGQIKVKLYSLNDYRESLSVMPGESLDYLQLDKSNCIQVYETEPAYLSFDDKCTASVKKTYSTNAFRSLCPVTGQPDLAALTIDYEGRAINPQGLLKYLISYRCHRGFHEQCVEQIYHDLKKAFNPEVLEVYACFTRRGGIDINPFRSSWREAPDKIIRENRQ